MSDADKAYAEAQRLIAEAKRTGAAGLGFDEPLFRSLARLPPEIAELDKLRSLDLRRTQIFDVSPLTSMNGLTWLRLSDTSVNDLSPISGLSGLAALLLDNTHIKDIVPLANQNDLTRLSLENTYVNDLRPLLGLRKLAERPGPTGLTFKGCIAA